MTPRSKTGVLLQVVALLGIVSSLFAPWGGWKTGEAGVATTPEAHATAPFVVVFACIALALAGLAVESMRGHGYGWLPPLFPIVVAIIVVTYVVTIGEIRGGPSIGAPVGWGLIVLGLSLLTGLIGTALLTYQRDELPAD